ncbi:MAG: hypothetical protein ACXAC7_13775 [Candidatus Hodarchaeales archaeon]|jgi:hypothetical protein
MRTLNKNSVKSIGQIFYNSCKKNGKIQKILFFSPQIHEETRISRFTGKKKLVTKKKLQFRIKMLWNDELFKNKLRIIAETRHKEKSKGSLESPLITQNYRVIFSHQAIIEDARLLSVNPTTRELLEIGQRLKIFISDRTRFPPINVQVKSLTPLRVRLIMNMTFFNLDIFNQWIGFTLNQLKKFDFRLKIEKNITLE